MPIYDNQTTSQIYYRPLRKWIEVTQEEKQNWECFIGTTRKAGQRAGSCCIPYKKKLQVRWYVRRVQIPLHFQR